MQEIVTVALRVTKFEKKARDVIPVQSEHSIVRGIEIVVASVSYSPTETEQHLFQILILIFFFLEGKEKGKGKLGGKKGKKGKGKKGKRGRNLKVEGREKKNERKMKEK